MKYTDEVMNVVNETANKINSIKEAEKYFNSQYTNESITQKTRDEKLKQLRDEEITVKLEAHQKVEEIRNRYKEHIKQMSIYSGDMLHDDAKLLEIENLTLNNDQFQALVEKHKDNVLMLNLLRSYQEKHKEIRVDLPPTLEMKEVEFDKYIANAQSTIREIPSIQTGLFLEGYYTPQIVDDEENNSVNDNVNE